MQEFLASSYTNDYSFFMGKGSGKPIETAIKNATSVIKIISPYLSKTTTEHLLRAHERGIKVHLITSNNDRKVFDIFAKLIVQQQQFLLEHEQKNRNQCRKYNKYLFHLGIYCGYILQNLSPHLVLKVSRFF